MSKNEMVTEITVLPAGASIDDPDVSSWSITVSYRGGARYAVLLRGGCLSAAGGWEHEPLPSSRDDDWLADHRFDLDAALAAAHGAVEKIMVNGMTWAYVVATREGRS